MSKIIPSLILTAALLAPAAANAKRARRTAPPAPTSTEAAPDASAPAATAPDAAPSPDAAGAAPDPAAAPVATVATAPSEDARKRLGVGYKIGNGLGFVGGDVIINIVDHLSLDLQAHRLSFDAGPDGTATGWGLGAEAQLFLKAGQVSSPYLGLGLATAHLSLQDVTGSATGYFANLGYEFRWSWGLGILLGAGAGYIGSVHATSPEASISTSGGAYFNIEGGLRYMFL
jgi:hypothetical protein